MERAMSVEYRIGDYLVSLVDDHPSVERDVTLVYPDVPRAAWAPFESIAFNKNGLFQATWRSHLVRRADGAGPKVLVDSGMGHGPHAHTGKNGNMLDNLRRLGVEPEEINAVVTTHCHGDHIGWNVTYDGDKPRLTFPFAKHYIAANDWAHYSKPGAGNAAFDRSVAPLKDLGVTTLPTNGHTPGHQCVLVQSGGQSGVLTGDLFHSVAQVTEQTWCPTFDWRTDLSTASRRWLMWRAQVEEWIVFSGHLPTGTSIGRIVERDGKPAWQPV
jgi:glyoxylase-like metal-dependent hydrolase (beta-lactamase superfamily II)